MAASDPAVPVGKLGDSDGKDLTGQVAKHYNELKEAGLETRKLSRIFFLRNFNNWIKSCLIGDTLQRIKADQQSRVPITVLDLCSGKGGDLLKWKKGEIDRLVCADIASTSVEQCEMRYKDMGRGRHDHHSQKHFTAEFIAADCTKERLKDRYRDPNTQFDLVSCQFSFHYSFESADQAEMMLRNACECLKPGGYFIGTTPNANEVVRRLRSSDGLSFGNEVYRITFPPSTDVDNLPLFGCQYNFHLEEVVDCPEFLVHFPLLEKMAEQFGMKLVFKKPFADYFSEKVSNSEARSLLGKMNALEGYPPDDGVNLVSKDSESYSATKCRWEELDQAAKQSSEREENRYHRRTKVGTLSQPEWEATTVYLVFAFQKVLNSENQGTASR